MAPSFFKSFFKNNPSQGAEHRLRSVIEVMLLVISADGTIDEDELTRFLERIANQASLEDLERHNFDSYVKQAFEDLQDEGPSRRLQVIAHHLNTTEQRTQALEMAIDVCLGDGKISPAEKTALRSIARAFRVPREQLKKLVEAQRSLFDAPITENSLLSHEQRVLDVLLLMAAADGQLEPSELARFGQRLAEHEAFQKLTTSTISDLMDRALRSIQEHGVERTVERITADVEDKEERIEIFQLALDMCLADGSADPHERTLLKLLQTHLDLNDETISTLIQNHLNAEDS